MNCLKIILISLLSYTWLKAPVINHTIPHYAPSLVPLGLCDKRYSLEMDRALNQAFRNIGNSAARANLMKEAEEYMILIKRQQDLDLAIRRIEAKIFSLDMIRVLRAPLQNYIKCKDHSDRGLGDNSKYGRNFEINSKVPTLTRLGYPLFIPVGHCDKQYAIQMEKALDDSQSIMKVELTEVAKEYMVLIKQQQDVDVRIRQLELRVFSMSTINILRKPIAEYNKCIVSVNTGNYQRNFYR